LRDRVKEFEGKGIQILVVYSQEPTHIRLALDGLKVKNVGPLREVCDQAGKPVFPLLGDPVSTVSATYGVAFQGFVGTHNRPATFVIDRDGVIRYEAKKGDVGDQPSAELLLKVIDGLAKKDTPKEEK
jgi:peroxiredoxin